MHKFLNFQLQLLALKVVDISWCKTEYNELSSFASMWKKEKEREEKRVIGRKRGYVMNIIGLLTLSASLIFAVLLWHFRYAILGLCLTMNMCKVHKSKTIVWVWVISTKVI